MLFRSAAARFGCGSQLNELTSHIDFVPYVSGWKGKGLDTKVSLKQALKALGFAGGSKRESELNQWINAEKEQLAAVMERHGIEWEQKGTHEEHLSVLDFKKQERKPFRYTCLSNVRYLLTMPLEFRAASTTKCSR